jgi:hypothetical protein
MRCHRFDLVYLRSCKAAIFGRLAALAQGVPLVRGRLEGAHPSAGRTRCPHGGTLVRYEDASARGVRELATGWEQGCLAASIRRAGAIVTGLCLAAAGFALGSLFYLFAARARTGCVGRSLNAGRFEA